MSVLAIANQKGGIGKTTTAVNLAAALSLGCERVLLVDFDPQANATLHLGVQPAKLAASVNEAVLGRRSFRAIIQPITEKLHLAPSHPSLTKGAQAIAAMPDPHTQLGYRLADIKDEYSYVIIDCPPSMYSLSENALAAADYVIVPVNADYLSLEGLGRFCADIELMKKEGKTQVSLLGILITMVDYRKGITKQSIELIRKHFGPLVFHTEIKINVKLEEAPSFGKHIFEYAPESVGAVCYLELAKEVRARCQRSLARA
jgi:chromosome partitioning protein